MGCLLLSRFLTLVVLLLTLGSATVIQGSTSLVARSSGALCSTYIVTGGDTCTKIAQSHGITVEDIEAFNAQTWAWHGCAQIQQGAFVCVSSGEPPMPVALPNAICGPQVPGTVRPKKYSDLASLNPCPASQCCSKLGQCGSTSAFCSVSQGCISHCKEDADTQPAVKASTATSMKSTATKPTMTTTSTSSKSTTTAAASATPHWQLTMYSKKDCEGDYYLLQGYNTWFDKCLRLQSGLSTVVSDKDLSCRWWVDGGFGGWKSCDESDLKKPRSWFMNNGSCMIYSDGVCEENTGTINGGKHLGCQSVNTMATEPDTNFESLQCASLV
ncbi:hypothetical protein F1880_008654 [Penicillium rolfsii]|nr:hypothetical protein F1880_008654 [Penicillium rolfsii]